MKPFFTIKAAAENPGVQEDTIELFGIVGDWWEGNDDTSFVNRVKALGPKVTVQINSFGGDLKAGMGIGNFLRGSGKEVTTVCMGVAASAASLIFCAGSRRVMKAGSRLMVHNSLAGVYGNATDLEKTAGILEGFDDSMAEFYAAAIGIEKSKATELMDAETWLGSKDALALGFATEIDTAAEELKAVAIAPVFAMKDPTQALPHVATSAPLASALKTAFGADFTSEGDVFAFVQKLHYDAEQHKANEVTARASIATLTAQVTADKETHAAALRAVETSVNVKVAEIVKAAGVKQPVAASTVTGESPKEELHGLDRVKAGFKAKAKS